MEPRSSVFRRCQRIRFMGLTVTNINTLNLLGILSQTEKSQTSIMEQLSTGLRINKGADDPAGLIALKNIEAEITAVDAAIANDQRTDAVLGVADSALGEIHSLLNEIESLIVASSSEANLSSAEQAANQSQIDDAIASIDRIVRTTTFNGKNLIDGTGEIDTINGTPTKIQDIHVYSRGNISSALTLDVTLDTAAAVATTSGNATDSVQFGANKTSGATELAITGSLGTSTVTIASGMTAGSAATVINAASDSTGVSATTSSNTLIFKSAQSGSDHFLMVDVLSGGDIVGGADSFNDVNKTSGSDAVGSVNGSSFTADGSKVSFNINGVSGAFSIASGASAGDTINFTVQTTGGFTFQLGADSVTQVTLGIDALFAHNLGGNGTDGYLNQIKSSGSYDLSTASSRTSALSIVREAIDQVAIQQGRIGGFQKFQVQPSTRNLQAAKEGLSAAASVIGDVDYAEATAELNMQQVLLQSGISLLGVANQQASQILSLLG